MAGWLVRFKAFYLCQNKQIVALSEPFDVSSLLLCLYDFDWYVIK